MYSTPSSDSISKIGLPQAAPINLVRLLQAEHAEIRQLFDLYEDLLAQGAPAQRRHELAVRACLAVAMHAVVEEEVVYPALRALPACRRALAEAEVEHAAARALIDEIGLLEPDDALFDAHVSVLGEYVRHHLVEEEAFLLHELEHSTVDLVELGRQARERRASLQDELDALDEED
ncbi:MAG TPA: hemerythrin domain-containing protein [Burkholderiaceae bacterium]|jgi:hemerythrin superfamily protein|nr:hemerythrin domain-containing protein [Burkholderiaceae bacterium]